MQSKLLQVWADDEMGASAPGRGSYGAVYKARDRATGDIVAVKVVPLSEGDDPALLAQEITVLAACDHPNVVRYLVHCTPYTRLTFLGFLSPPSTAFLRPDTLTSPL